MKLPIIKASTLILFFGAIGFFVACKAGYFDGKPSKSNMSSSKSGAVISPKDKGSSSFTQTDSQKLKMMSSSKSGIVFDELYLKPDTTPSLPTASLTIDDVQKGKYLRPTSSEILRLEKEVQKERTMISSSKVIIIEHKRLDQLIDSLAFMRKLDSLFKVMDKQQKKD